ncbi:hypothetical protein EZS27_018771, partial [termite gut metagenome]
MEREANLIRKAVDASISANIRTQDIQLEGEKAYGTSEVGEW